MTEAYSAPQTEPFDFPDPEPLDFSDTEQTEILNAITDLNSRNVQGRDEWQAQHLLYDQMWRGDMPPRSGPWQGASDLHVQMPFWAADAMNTRLVNAIWGQTPLVSGEAEEDDDQEVFRNAKDLVDWHLQPKRMNARKAWGIISKMRCIHGVGHGLALWVKDQHTYRMAQAGAGEILWNPDGTIQMDEETGEPAKPPSSDVLLQTKVGYDGPIITPLEWDDVIYPLNGMNCQPVTVRNPLGADYLGIRQWESLSLMWKKRRLAGGQPGAYSFIDELPAKEGKERDWWVSKAPSQDRAGSGDGSQETQERVKAQDRAQGTDRSQEVPRSPQARPNPEFEILTWFMPWEIDGPDGKEEAECVFFLCKDPEVLLGAYRLTDISWQNIRPIIELHYQTVGTRHESMGIMEVAKHLSAELDTIHNMRMDVGFATNMPFFFFRATSGMDPERIELRPLKGVPVDDINDVKFPQLQNVTSFYAEEEQLLYSLTERVLGISDLFLGRSPTQGAAARHATGFVGTQQESMARTSEILNSDSEEFGRLCRMIYNMELQYGPPERNIRLQGREGAISQVLTREELWLRGEYDFRLGANDGMYNSQLRQQQSQLLMSSLQMNPFLAQDPGRMWEAWSEILGSWGYKDIERFIGPKEAVGPGAQKTADEENGEMTQQVHGTGIPAPIHPNDNDQEHLQGHMAYLQSPAYEALGRPNQQGHMQHLMMTQQAIQQKQQMQMQPQPGQGSPPAEQGGPALGQERIMPQMMGGGGMGTTGGANAAPQPTGAPAPNGPPMMGGA